MNAASATWGDEELAMLSAGDDKPVITPHHWWRWSLRSLHSGGIEHETLGRTDLSTGVSVATFDAGVDADLTPDR